MDEGAAAALSEDGAEGRPHGEDDTPRNYSKATETADSKFLDTSATNFEQFRYANVDNVPLSVFCRNLWPPAQKAF